MTPDTDCPDGELGDDRLSRYHVTARVQVQTHEVLLAPSALDAAEFHEAAVELISEELDATLEEFELLEVVELGEVPY